MHVCVCTHVNEKVEKGLRRQQLAWELRGHSGRIDFINRLSQHSGSGCSRAHWRHRMWDRNRQDEQTKHICIISFWQQNRNQASQILTHTAHFSDLQTLSPLNDMWFWRWRTSLDVVFLNFWMKQQCMPAYTAMKLRTLGMFPNLWQCFLTSLIFSHLFR